jgi:hypothetical protein
MAQAHRRELWNHTSAVLALVANCHRDPKKTRPFKPADFHPDVGKNRAAPVAKADITVLKAVFVDRRY